MDGKHLAKGSTNPPQVKGKIRLYSMRFCPFAQRAHLVFDAKKIPHDIVMINLTNKPEWFFDKNPLGTVPTIEFESGESIYESLIIADYLDEKYPQTPLHSKDPLQKAKDKLLVERFNKVPGMVYKFFFDSSKDNFENVLTELDVFEKELGKRETPFFGGEKPGMVDYMIWPWFERIDAFKMMTGGKFVVPKNRYIRLEEWKKAMLEDEAVKISYIDPDNHAKYIKGRLTGTPDYDILAK